MKTKCGKQPLPDFIIGIVW